MSIKFPPPRTVLLFILSPLSPFTFFLPAHQINYSLPHPYTTLSPTPLLFLSLLFSIFKHSLCFSGLSSSSSFFSLSYFSSFASILFFSSFAFFICYFHSLVYIFLEIFFFRFLSINHHCAIASFIVLFQC